MKKNKTKKSPIFWILYILYVLALSGAICYGISWLWKFLAVYEETRPVHFMEDSLYLFDEAETAQLQKYLTNTVENPYEDISALLSIFYDSIEGEELSFGKLAGQYTELHPVYAVLADDVHVATISFVSDNVEVGHNFCGWTVEAISLLVSPTKSFAVTVPSSMTLTVNGKPVSETHHISTTETDTPVSYVNYACTGELYLEPELQVIDRYGCNVPLQKDEATGGLYYQLSYAHAPASMELSFGGHVLSEEHTLVSGIPVEKLDFLQEVASHFPEYAQLPELVERPTFQTYFIDFAFEKDEVAATDRFGEKRTLEYDEATRMYSHQLISNDALKAECVERTTSFLETYALFCAGDVKKTALQPYFPKDSEFYSTIVLMNNNWFGGHTKIQFTNHQVKDFFAYTDNLAYIYMTIDQEFTATENDTDKVLTIDIPLWLVKMDEEWYVASIIFDKSAEE